MMAKESIPAARTVRGDADSEHMGGTVEVCVVGLGPRGLSVLDRLCANASECLNEGDRLRIHLVDPHLRTGSRVWRTGQAAELLMNTVAAQVTMFVDDSVDCAGPVLAGPSLYEWARFLTLIGPLDDEPPAVLAEAARLGPDDYPSRAFYGQYLSWVLRHLVRHAPRRVTIVQHPCRAVDLVDADNGTQTLTLDGGARLTGLDQVVLAMGHLDTHPGEREEALREFADDNDLYYHPPGNPAETDLSAIEPGEPVILRGMGLNFFDHMALLTTGRGGVFTRDGDKVTYRPSRREPRMIAGCRRGVPHHSRGANQKGAHGRHEPLCLTPPVIAAFRARAEQGDLPDFGTEVWPLIDREVRAVYYSTLIRGRDCVCDADEFRRRYLATEIGTENPDLLAECGIGPDEHWDWQRVAHPHDGIEFTGPDHFHDWLVSYLEADVREAQLGTVDGPLKAALDVLRDLRNEIRLVVDHSGISGESYRDALRGWYTPFNAFVSIGPPVSRIEEMIALIEAGVLSVVGPGMTVGCVDGGFVTRSARVPGVEYRAKALVEARLPETDVRTTSDPLIRRLLTRGDCTHYRIPQRDGGHYETGGLAVTRSPYHLVDVSGRAHPRRFAFGVPTESVHWVTAAGIRPGVNSVILGDADAVARTGLLAARALSVH